MSKEMLVGVVFMLAVGLTLFGTVAVSGLDLFSPKVTWYVQLKTLNGLEETDDVRVLGHRMGSIKKIRFDQEKYLFRLTLKMAPEAPIREGYRIVVRDASALGGKYLSVEPGDPGAPAADVENLSGDATVPDVMAGISDVLTELKKVVTAVTEAEGTVGKLIMQDDLYKDVRTITESLRAVADRVEKGQGMVGRLINEDHIYVQLMELSTKLNKGDGLLAKLMKDESGTIIDDLRTAAADIKSIAAKLNKGKGTAALMLNDSRLYESANGALASAGGVIDDARAGKGVVGMLLADTSARRNAATMLDNARAVTDQVRAGSGSLGRFLTEDDLYENANGAANHLRSAAAKLDTGNGTVAKLLNDPVLHDTLKKLLSRAIDAIENARDSAPVSAVSSLLLGPFQ
jgi:phospholipid/cholesterol/gamma-HCH transport system substrate-binding protein